jgi:hypothetical protein
MRPHCSLVLACAIVLAGGDATADGEPARVRGLEPIAVRLLQAARAGSPTFRCLLDRLEQSDLIVYVQFTPRDQGPRALTTIAGAIAGSRVVLSSITSRAGDADRLLLLGHELQHAVELADAPEARDRAGIAALYARIGWSDRPDSYETAAAVDAGNAVRREMFDAARRVRLATAIAAARPPRAAGSPIAGWGH